MVLVEKLKICHFQFLPLYINCSEYIDCGSTVKAVRTNFKNGYLNRSNLYSGHFTDSVIIVSLSKANR